MAWSVVVLAVVIVLGACKLADAETPVDFRQGVGFFTLRGAFQNERHGENLYLASVTAGVGRYFLDNAAVEFQLVGYQAHDEEDSLGLGANAMARYHLVHVGGVSLYGEVLGGIFGTTDDFPTGGTCFNFTYGGGPGLTIRLREGLRLDGGLRFQHVSNGFIEGRDRNPIFNSFGGYLGVVWTR